MRKFATTNAYRGSLAALQQQLLQFGANQRRRHFDRLFRLGRFRGGGPSGGGGSGGGGGLFLLLLLLGDALGLAFWPSEVVKR